MATILNDNNICLPFLRFALISYQKAEKLPQMQWFSLGWEENSDLQTSKQPSFKAD